MEVKGIFSSIQGEGQQVGKLAVFIRLSGCNLNCPWCDTDHYGGVDLNHNEIIERVLEKANHLLPTQRPMIVWTGGEPLLQLTDGSEGAILEKLGKLGFFQAVETNGTIPLSDFIKRNVRWITVSPKPHMIDEHTEIEVLGTANEVKVVYTADFDEENFQKTIEFVDEHFSGHKFIQPRGENCIQETVHRLFNFYSDWRLSLQIQKFIDLE